MRKAVLLAALMVAFAASTAYASKPSVIWFNDTFASYDVGGYGLALQNAAPNWQAAPEGGSNGQLRVVHSDTYGEGPDYTGEGKFVEFKGDSHVGNNSHCQTTANLSSLSSGKVQIFHLRSRMGMSDIGLATPFPGRTGWYHASFNIRDASNNDIACWAAGSLGLKSHLTTAPIVYPVWEKFYYGMLPQGWAGGPVPVDTTPGVEWLFPDKLWHDFDITYDPATGVTKWFADGVLIWTQTQASGRSMNKIWVRDVCVRDGIWAWEDHVYTDEMAVGTNGTPVVTAPIGGASVATTKPTVVWANTAPADPLVAIQVKICSVDNSSGATVYDSGTVTSSYTVHTATSAVPAGVQLWAFVREQHSVGGWTVWSATGNGGFTATASLPGRSPVVSFTATAGVNQNALTWTNPTDASFTGTMIRCKTTGYPTSASDGSLVCNRSAASGSTDNYTHTTVTAGLTYYYCAYAHDATPNYAAPNYAYGTPRAPDVTAPSAVTKFTATKVAGKIELSWRSSPEPDTTGVMIRYSTTAYPANPSSGTLLVDEPGASNSEHRYNHTGVAMGTVYYYTAFAHDNTPNYSAGAQAVSTNPSLRVHPDNPHYFQDTATGEAVMITSFTSIVPTDTSVDYTADIAEMHSRRIDYSRVWHFLPWAHANAVWPWGRSSTPGAPMGGNKIDMNTWNTTYWDRMKDSLAKASTGGTYGEILLFDRCGLSPNGYDRYQGNPWAWDNNINNLEMPDASLDGTPDFYYWDTKPNLRAQQEKYVRKMVDETIQYKNVIYEAENEHWEWSNPWFGWHISDYTREYLVSTYPTSPRLISYSSLEDDLETFYSIESCNIVNKHFGNSAETDPGVLNNYIEIRWDYNKAINIDEFANGVGDYATMAKMCWTIITSGGNFHIEDADPTISYDVVENIRSFKSLSGWDFVHAAPNKALVTSGGGYCMAQPGVEYVCFFLVSGGKTIILEPGNYTARWWNPRKGGFSNVTTFSHSGGGKGFNTPGSDYWVLQITTQAASTVTILQSLAADSITIDGNPNDWSLPNFATKIRGGDTGVGNIGVAGYEGPIFYAGGHSTWGQFAPANAADHSVRIYSRNDASNLYFLMRFDDNDIRYPDPASTNWNNDCVEIYIDPGNNGGTTPISGSTSDLQLIIDANNQKNIYGTTSGYATTILGGVTSAVVRDATGWWLEVKMAKNVFSPALPATGTIGIDFCFRDNDNNNDAALSTLYSWREPDVSSTFPTKIPDKWGDLVLSTSNGDLGSVSNFTATPGDEEVTLSWTNPIDAMFTGTMIRYSSTGYPANESDGTLLIDKSGAPGSSDNHIHTGLTNGVTYYYSAFAHDVVPTYSAKADVNATPADSGPQPVTNFTATPGNKQISLSWHNPLFAGFTGTMIRYKTDGYPTSVTDGTLVCDRNAAGGSNDSYTHTGLANGTTYFYSAFAHDNVPNYTAKADVNAVPVVSVATLNVKPAGTITIDGLTGDWTLTDFTTKVRGGESVQGDYALVGFDGATLYYGGYWTTAVLPTNAADHTAKIYSRHNATYQYFLIRCDDNNMNYAQPASANWANDCLEFYIDPGHDHGSTALFHPGGTSTSDLQLVIDANNQKNVYCTTSGYATQVLAGVTSAVVRDGTGWWLEVRIQKSVIDPDLPASGTFGVDFAFRDNDNPDATYIEGNPTTSTMYMWNDNTIGASYPTKIPNLWGDALIQNTIPAVTGFLAAAGDRQITLSWTNPTSAYFTGTMIRYKTGGYPTSPTDGNVACDKFAASGSTDSYVHTGLTNGTMYFYSAFAHDNAGTYSVKATRLAAPSDTIPPASVTAFNVIIGDQKNYLYWTNPTDADLAGVKILAKTGSYPTGITDGTATLIYTGTGTSATHASLTNGTMQYYSAFAYDEVPNYSVKADINGTPAYIDPAGAKILANTIPITLTAGTVSAFFTDSFYVQCSDKPIGIRVDKAAHGLTLGQTAWAKGTAEVDATGEKYLLATWAQGSGTGSVSPYALAN
ncbi:MAG: sugar-binding protein, partial [Armatimonadota bacterium]|nr:sugar-binding protein [Armatimonadota bacterium]